jgi:hypothetical protein
MLLMIPLDGMVCNVQVEQSPRTLLHAIDKSKTDTRILEAYLRRKGVNVDDFYKLDQPITLLSDLVSGPPQPCRYSVKENVQRLLRLGGDELPSDGTLHLKKPLLVSQDGMVWEEAVHAHHVQSRFGRHMEGTHYKEGITIVKSSTRMIINTFTFWDGELWVSMAAIIDCESWTIKDVVVNGLLNGLSRWPQKFQSAFEQMVDEYAETYPNGWTWIRQPSSGDCVYKTGTDQHQRPVLIDVVGNAKFSFNHLQF